MIRTMAVMLSMVLLLCACGQIGDIAARGDATEIHLSDESITVDGAAVSTDADSNVYVANDIVYYESGKDFTYGEGTEKDAHSAEDAAAHTVLHISKAGTYAVSGKLSRGQIAVDLGEDAEEDPQAVVTLILDGVDITCEVAPAIIFYSVYECGSTDTETASKDVDTTAAGANVVIADGTENTVNGSYVARIYKPGTVELSDDGTEVEDAKKLHKYDAAFYSKMSMNIGGGKDGSGVLHINAANEGLDSELHLTINGGNIDIKSGNDGINTNEDKVSVTTVNGGTLTIEVTGETGEGDGIDSNGWLVINGGTVTAAACSTSADAGIDSDMGIHINGGTVIATGSMLDRIEDGGQTYAVFNFAEKQKDAGTITLKDSGGKAVMTYEGKNAYSVLIYSSSDLAAGSYTLWSGKQQLAGNSGGATGGFGRPNTVPNGGVPSEGFEPPEGSEPPNGEMPQRPEMPEGFDPSKRPERPEGEMPPMGNPPSGGEQPAQRPDDVRDPMQQPDGTAAVGDLSTEFKIVDGANMFSGITYRQ